MKVQSSMRARLCGVAVLMALAAGCGGGGGGGGGTPGPVPPGPPPGPPPAPELRGWSKPFGSASVVLGHSGFDRQDPRQENPPEGAATPLQAPLGRPAVDSQGRLLVAANSGVMGFNNYEARNGPVADLEATLAHEGNGLTPGDISVQGQRVVIAARENYVLIFNAPPTASFAPANVVAGDGSPACSESQLDEPAGAQLTAEGRLIVADSRNNRVLIWDNVPPDGTLGAAQVVLGQASMTSCDQEAASRETLASPRSVWSDGTRLIVADTGNNRVLVWNDIRSVTSGQAADVVLGQRNFVDAEANAGEGVPGQGTLFEPTSVDVSTAGELAVADSGNNRVLIWKSIPQPSQFLQPADYVVGQSDFVHGASNDVDQTGLPGTSLSAKTLSYPYGVRFHGRNLIVNDHSNNRVLVWRESE